LQIELSCASFTQAARAVAAGAYGGVLPSLARSDFKPGETMEFALPFLKSYARPIVVAWNPRLIEVRPVVERSLNVVLSPKFAIAQ
jgi:hypothetical protein